MNKEEIIIRIDDKYGEFINYMSELSHEDFNFCHREKWSAGQQLEHIIMCVKPLVQVYGMPKSIIEQNFGRTERLNKSYLELLDGYLEKLNGGGKAPIQYIPEPKASIHRATQIKELKSLMEDMNSKVESFQEKDLESLLVPHPLLGKITLKEMLYNAIYHVEHHQMQVAKNLATK